MTSLVSTSVEEKFILDILEPLRETILNTERKVSDIITNFIKAKAKKPLVTRLTNIEKWLEWFTDYETRKVLIRGDRNSPRIEDINEESNFVLIVEGESNPRLLGWINMIFPEFYLDSVIQSPNEIKFSVLFVSKK